MAEEIKSLEELGGNSEEAVSYLMLLFMFKN